MKKTPFIITLDGHSACGKSTLAKAIAKALGFVYVDSGAMYRAVTLYALEVCNGNVDKLIENIKDVRIEFKYDEKGNLQTFLNGECVEHTIRGVKVSNFVSLVSQEKKVREHLVDLQRKMGETQSLVMDGRDIGSVVFPNADVKFWVQADLNIRANRRYVELKQAKEAITLEQVARHLAKRDENDINRAESPLVKPNNSKVLDTSHKSVQQILEQAMTIIKSQID